MVVARDADRPLRDAVEEVDGAVERVDDPADATRAGRPRTLLAEHAVARALVAQQADDQRLRVTIGIGDGIGLRALQLEAGGRSFEAVDQERPRSAGGPHGEVEQGVRISGRQEWRGPDLNRRHPGFQPSALPAELPRRRPHQATTGLLPARQSIGRRSSTSSPTAIRNSRAASPPLTQIATAPAESTRTTNAPGGTSANVRPRRAAPRGRPRTPIAMPLPATSPAPSRSAAVAASAQLPKRSMCAQGAWSMPDSTLARGSARRTTPHVSTPFPSAAGDSPSASRPAAGAKTSRP